MRVLSFATLGIVTFLLGSCAPQETGSTWRGGSLAAIGDSFASGVGASGMQKECGRSEKGWPGLLAEDLGMEYVNLACSGATIEEAIEQVKELPDGVDLVAVNAGGNTVGFVEALILCQSGACDSARQLVIERLPRLRSDLTDLIAAIHEFRPSVSRILVMSYPIATVPGEVCDGMVVGTSEGFSEQWRLNEVMADVVAEASASGVPVTLVDDLGFEGHELCTDDPWFFGFGSGLLVLHPNDSGYRALADAAARSIERGR
jgi:lysophospholipase L1-like esterase